MSMEEGCMDHMVLALRGCLSKDPRASEPFLSVDKVPPKIWDNITAMACHKNGCRVLQSMLDDADSFCRVAIARAFQGKVWDAILSQHAHHVLQRIIELVPPATISFIVLEIQCGCGTVFAAKHRFGCRVCERVLEHFPPALLSRFVEDIISHTLELCVHSYGTFVLQHVFEHGCVEHCDEIAQTLLPRVAWAVKNENAVGVVDSALSYASQQMRCNIATAIRECEGLMQRMVTKRRSHGLVMRMIHSPYLTVDWLQEAVRCEEFKSNSAAVRKQLQEHNVRAGVKAETLPEQAVEARKPASMSSCWIESSARYQGGCCRVRTPQVPKQRQHHTWRRAPDSSYVI